MAAKDDGYIRWRCKSCGQRLKVRDTFEGGDVMPCPRCGVSVNVPLANIEAIAKGTDMPETGRPGRLNVDPELLRKRLAGQEERPEGPGSIGGPPTLRQEAWSPEAAFGRVEELDQLAASLSQIESDVMGQVQRLYRDRELDDEAREQQVKEAGRMRREDIRELLQKRMAGIQSQARHLQRAYSRLNPSQQEHMDRLKRAFEALKFYGQHVLGIDR
ncbi:MAG: hypothetical protein ACYS8K_10415 [Planctomycetota bacterium]|jgi:hypothetical protein